MKQCCSTSDGHVFAVQFQSPTTANSDSDGYPAETYSSQFTRRCTLKELTTQGDNDEMVGPHLKGLVRYEFKCQRDPETSSVTGKWRAYLPQLSITLNIKAQGAVEGRRLRFVGVHKV